MPISIRRHSVPLTLAAILALTSGGIAAATPLQTQPSGTNGVATFLGSTATPCGPADVTWFVASDELPSGAFSGLASDMDIAIGIASSGAAASLLPESSVEISNARGAILLMLDAWSCPGQLAAGGGAVSGTGTWSVDPEAASGSYRQATGSGTFDLASGVAPGDGNPWSIALNGDVQVLQPNLVAEVSESTWRHYPGDPPGRIATVTFRITNTGPGDAFAATFAEPDVPGGFELLSGGGSALGDLPAGASVERTLRWSVRGLRGSAFDAALQVPHADALDVGISADPVLHVVMPTRT